MDCRVAPRGFRSQSVLLLPGDWTSSGSTDWLPRFASTASIAIRLAAARQVSRSTELLAATAPGERHCVYGKTLREALDGIERALRIHAMGLPVNAGKEPLGKPKGAARSA
jgi:hypothetical protein